MGWLAVTESQRGGLEALNAVSPEVRVNVIRGSQGGWLANDAALSEAVVGGYLQHFAEWYAGLTPSDDVPAPRPPRPKRP
jgi:hypothetical protein